jgi:FkbM family methyltransferase
MYSQNLEEKFILDYFGSFKGILLDLGANDGQTFSNSRQLLLNGWSGILVDASPSAVDALNKLYPPGGKVSVINGAVGLPGASGYADFLESGPHLPNKSDYGLLSSLLPGETDRWVKQGVKFTSVRVPLVSVASLYALLPAGAPGFDFITIDIEGMDLAVLSQLDLSGTRLLCIEHNGNPGLLDAYKKYCAKFGLNTALYSSGENVIFAR